MVVRHAQVPGLRDQWQTKNLDCGSGTTASDSYTYGYDASGNLTSFSNGSGSTALTYDALNRLTGNQCRNRHRLLVDGLRL